MEEIDLGFAEKTYYKWLTNLYFPSKLGGMPAWLELKQLPTKEQLFCSKCQCPKSFLCQLYAPYDDVYNFHRTIYVFICRNNSCQMANNSNNITVLRSQLARENPFYSLAPPEDTDDPMPEIPAQQLLCFVCGCPSPFTCSRCKTMNYCSAQHQRAHWPEHKQKCCVALEKHIMNQLINISFPEYEIVMETCMLNGEQPIKSVKDLIKEEQVQLAEFQKLANKGVLQEVSDAELSRYVGNADAADDKSFTHFKNVTKAEPKQIVRYKRGGKPLWIADVQQTVAEQLNTLPNCELCGSERQFEFQIMPQMLVLLKDEKIDWGVLAVYTCKKSCNITGYATEHVIKQDILPTQTN